MSYYQKQEKTWLISLTNSNFYLLVGSTAEDVHSNLCLLMILCIKSALILLFAFSKFEKGLLCKVAILSLSLSLHLFEETTVL